LAPERLSKINNSKVGRPVLDSGKQVVPFQGRKNHLSWLENMSRYPKILGAAQTGSGQIAAIGRYGYTVYFSYGESLTEKKILTHDNSHKTASFIKFIIR
jgi:hypothetical protein